MAKSALPCAATASATCMTAGNVITPGGNPVTEVPVLSPRSPPVIIVSPVFVTVELARISKFAADPSGTAVWQACVAVVKLQTKSLLARLETGLEPPS